MENKELLDKIYNKVEKLVEQLNDLNITVAKQEINLKDHMRRSDLLEEEVKLLDNRITPIEDHVKFVGSVTKVCGTLFASASAITAVVELIRFFK